MSDTLQWVFDITKTPLAHAFADTRITTPSLCGNYKTVNGGPWVFAKETTPQCADCIEQLTLSAQKTKED